MSMALRQPYGKESEFISMWREIVGSDEDEYIKDLFQKIHYEMGRKVTHFCDVMVNKIAKVITSQCIDRFSHSMYKHIITEKTVFRDWMNVKDNNVYSPWGLFHLLSILYQECGSRTKENMRIKMGLPDDPLLSKGVTHLHRLVRNELYSIRNYYEDDKEEVMFYGRQHINLSDQFIDHLKNYYDDCFWRRPLRALREFAIEDGNKEISDVMNRWIIEKHNDAYDYIEIEELLRKNVNIKDHSPNSFYIHHLIKKQIKFKDDFYIDEMQKFWTSQEEFKLIPYMTIKNKGHCVIDTYRKVFNLHGDDKCIQILAIEIPIVRMIDYYDQKINRNRNEQEDSDNDYSLNSNASMWIVKPQYPTDIVNIEDNIEKIRDIITRKSNEDTFYRIIDISLPQLTLCKTFNMTDSLKDRGITFDINDTFRMTYEKHPEKSVQPSNLDSITILQTVSISTEAEACPKPYPKKDVNQRILIDHPFYMFIIENKYNLTLFEGSVKDL